MKQDHLRLSPYDLTALVVCSCSEKSVTRTS